MSYYVRQETYQIETQSDLHLFPSEDLAIKKYNNYVENNIPVEYYKEGIKLKEYKPCRTVGG